MYVHTSTLTLSPLIHISSFHTGLDIKELCITRDGGKFGFFTIPTVHPIICYVFHNLYTNSVFL